jgi:ABC-type transport system substrate-binding protein
MCVAGALGLVLTACSSTNGSGDATAGGAATDDQTTTTEGPPVDGGKLVFGVYAETDGWNPHANQWAGPGSLVGSSMMEPLATIDADLNPIPWLATSWTPNATFDSWTIELRDDVTFSNGEAFDAAAVKLNLDDLAVSPLASVVWAPVIEGTEVIDDHTVRLDVTRSFAALPNSLLASPSSFMMAPAMIQSSDGGSKSPIGTGPFTFESWQSGSQLTVVKNPTYWQDGLPHLDEIEFKVLPDASAMASGLLADDIDMVFTDAIAPPTQVDDTFTVIKNWGAQPGLAITNTFPEVGGKPNPMANVHARRALAYATDQQALADFIGEGVETPTSPFAPESKWALSPDDSGYVDRDLEHAKEEIATYEADTGATGVADTLVAPVGSDYEPIVQMLQSQWAEAGIDTTIEAVETSALIGQVVGGNYQVALFALYSAPDPDQNYHYWSAGTAPGPGAININFTQYTTPELEKNIDIGREDPDFEDRKAAYDAVVKEINGAAVNIWTYSLPCSMVANGRVGGLTKVETVPFCDYQPKTWLGDLWLEY